MNEVRWKLFKDHYLIRRMMQKIVLNFIKSHMPQSYWVDIDTLISMAAEF